MTTFCLAGEESIDQARRTSLYYVSRHLHHLAPVNQPGEALRVDAAVLVPPFDQFIPPTKQEVPGNEFEPGRE